MEFFAMIDWSVVIQIIIIDLLLGGDNAVVIALACRNLHPNQRRKGIIWGTAGAIILRVILVAFAVTLLQIPFLKLVGGALLLWIGYKLMVQHDEEEHNMDAPDKLFAAIKTIIDSGIPTFGICLGHQLLALASQAKTHKMKFGHHGANHPVQDIKTKRVYITSQNHGFAVDAASLPANLKTTHVSLFDGSLQGIARTDKPAFSFQGHPEASPGPTEMSYLFDQFIELMETGR